MLPFWPGETCAGYIDIETVRCTSPRIAISLLTMATAAGNRDDAEAYIEQARDILDKIASMFSRYSTVGRDATVCHAGCATGPELQQSRMPTWLMASSRPVKRS